MRLLTTIAIVAATSVAAPAFADKKAECELQAKIVTRAAELRMERKSEKKAIEIMTSGEDEAVAEKYIPAVPPIVDWVYNSLKRKQLKMDPGGAYLETCVNN